MPLHQRTTVPSVFSNWSRSPGLSRLLGLLGIGLALAAPSEAQAQRLAPKPGIGASVIRGGKHCLDEQQNKLLLNHYTAGSINPLGIETQFRLSYCTPLIEKPGILFSLSKLDVGLVTYISPAHVHIGPSLHVSPLSILVLRAEVTGFYIWPIPLQGAGVNEILKDKQSADMQGCYLDPQPPVGADGKTPERGPNPANPFCDYNPNAPDPKHPERNQTPYSAFEIEALQRDTYGPRPGRDAFGIRALLGITLQGAIPLGNRVDILFADGFSTEFWRINSNEYYYLARRDTIMHGNGDWVLANTAALLLSIRLHRNALLRLGATDDLVYTPNFGYMGNIAAGLVSLSVPNLRNLAKQFAVFVRVGTFTHHQFRSGVTLAAGFDITYELKKKPTRRALEEQQASEAATAQPPPDQVAPAPPPEPPATPPPPVAPTTSESPTSGGAK